MAKNAIWTYDRSSALRLAWKQEEEEKLTTQYPSGFFLLPPQLGRQNCVVVDFLSLSLSLGLRQGRRKEAFITNTLNTEENVGVGLKAGLFRRFLFFGVKLRSRIFAAWQQTFSPVSATSVKSLIQACKRTGRERVGESARRGIRNTHSHTHTQHTLLLNTTQKGPSRGKPTLGWSSKAFWEARSCLLLSVLLSLELMPQLLSFLRRNSRFPIYILTHALRPFVLE